MKKKNPIENRSKIYDIDYALYHSDKNIRSGSFAGWSVNSVISKRSYRSHESTFLGIPKREIGFRLCRTTRRN